MAATHRIVLDLSNVTHVDSTGLGALLGAWTAAKSKGCDVEMANLNPRVEKLVEITKLDTVFKRARVVAAATPAVDTALSLDPEDAWQQAIGAGQARGAAAHYCDADLDQLVFVIEPMLDELVKRVDRRRKLARRRGAPVSRRHRFSRPSSP